MKKEIFLLAILGVGLFVMGVPVEESEAAPKIVLNAISAWPVTHVNNDYYKIYIKRVNDNAKGELEIKLLGGPEVVSAYDQLKAVSKRVVDMVFASQEYYVGIVPEGTIPQLAKHEFQVKAYRESGLIEPYTQAYLERGKVFFLGNLYIGVAFYIMTKKPVSKLEEIRGLKLRGADGLGDVLVGELGASVVKISSAETYEGLQRGVVDGAFRNIISLVEFKEYEVMKYILFPPIVNQGIAVWVGEEIWNTIPKHLQTMMKGLAVEAEAEAYKYYTDMGNARLKEVQEKHGMKVVHLSDKDIEKFHEILAGPAVKNWIYTKAPKFGPPIYEKVLPYIK